MGKHSRRAVLAVGALSPLLPLVGKAEPPTLTRTTTVGPIQYDDWDLGYEGYGWIWRTEIAGLLHPDDPELLRWAYDNRVGIAIEGFDSPMFVMHQSSWDGQDLFYVYADPSAPSSS